MYFSSFQFQFSSKEAEISEYFVDFKMFTVFRNLRKIFMDMNLITKN